MYNPSRGNHTRRDKVFVNSVIVWRLDQSRLGLQEFSVSWNKAFEASGQASAMFTYSELDAIQGMWKALRTLLKFPSYNLQSNKQLILRSCYEDREISCFSVLSNF